MPTVHMAVVDTIGAGNSHIGAVIACRKLGLPYREALEYANRVAGAVVSVRDATLGPDEFRGIPLPRGNA